MNKLLSQNADPHAMPFVHLLLRKGYDGNFILTDRSSGDSVTGKVEECFTTIKAQPEGTPQRTFGMETYLRWAGDEDHRRCWMNVRYDADTGYHISAVEIAERGISHKIHLTANEQLPFQRTLREMKLQPPRWTKRIIAWIDPITQNIKRKP